MTLAFLGLLWVAASFLLDLTTECFPYPYQLLSYAAGVLLSLMGAILDRAP